MTAQLGLNGAAAGALLFRDRVGGIGAQRATIGSRRREKLRTRDLERAGFKCDIEADGR